MQEARLAGRLQKELKMLQDPPPGVCVWPSNDQSLSRLEAQIQGPEGTVYAKGIFKLQVQIPDRYPFEPPNVKFITPVYHPNIDSGGRICHDILNMPPKGQWKPSLNIGAVLASIRVLMEEPNHDDGLMSDITAEYKHHRAIFDAKARESTKRFAMQTTTQRGAGSSRDDRPQITAPQMISPKDENSEIIKSTPERPVRKDEMRMEASNLSIEDPGTSTSSWCDTVPSFTHGKARLNLPVKLSLGKGSTGTLSKSYSSNESVREPASINSLTFSMEGERVAQPRASFCQTSQTASQPGENGPPAHSTWRQTTCGIASQRASELGEEHYAYSAQRETTSGLSSQRASQRGPTERETTTSFASQASQREATRKLGRNGFPILHTEKEATSALGDVSRMKLSETLSTGADSANNSLKGERLTDTLDKTEKTSLTERNAARPSQKTIDSITVSSKENISINKQVSTIAAVKQASTPDKGNKRMLRKAKTLKLSRPQMSLTQNVQPTSRSGMHTNELRQADKEDVIMLDSGSDEEDCIRQQRVQLGVKRKAQLPGLRS